MQMLEQYGYEPAILNLAKTHFIKPIATELDPLNPVSYDYLKSPIDKRLHTRRHLRDEALPNE